MKADQAGAVRRDPWWSLGVLAVLYVFSFIDRSALSLFVEPIKAELGLSDTQFGLITGTAFALFYSTLSLPIAAWSDKHSRKWAIFAGVALWGAMTLGCGFTTGFGMLFLMRMGVGLGEAALTPNAWAFVAEGFPEAKQGRAMATFVTGAVIGSGLSMIAPGLIAGIAATMVTKVLPSASSLAQWRMALVGVGGITMLLCVPALFIVESKRNPARASVTAKGSTREYLLHCWQNRRALSGLFLAGPLLNAIAIGTMIWLPAYYLRNRGWSTEDTGTVLGATFIVSGFAGTVLAGIFIDRLRIARNPDAALKLVINTSLASLPFLAVALFLSGAAASIACLVVSLTLSNFMSTLLPVASQARAPEGRGAEAAALFLLLANLAGYGLGPTLPALVSDYVFSDPKTIGLSVLVVATLGTLLSAAVVRWSGLPRDLIQPAGVGRAP